MIEVLASLRAKASCEDKPSLVVLTPYNEQARRLARRIGVEMKGRLAHLKDFALHDPVVHTIDSFQGDEADVVVASLVRNNPRGWYKGLGILGDSRRMNVLLSRARWTTVLVGSLDFLRRRFPPKRAAPEDLRFLRQFIRLLAHRPPRTTRATRTKSISVIRVASIKRRKSR